MGLFGKSRASLSRYLASSMNDEALSTPGVKEIVALVARIADFDTVAGRMNLEELGQFVDHYYKAIADAVLGHSGDVCQFGGALVVSHFGALVTVSDFEVISAAEELTETLGHLEKLFGAHTGIGICRGTVIYGSFGSSRRAAVAAFGAPIACACHLSRNASAISLCARFATPELEARMSRDSRMTIRPHSINADERS